MRLLSIFFDNFDDQFKASMNKAMAYPRADTQVFLQAYTSNPSKGVIA